jgi:hypothetical protein
VECILGLESKYKSDRIYSKKSPVFTGLFSLLNTKKGCKTFSLLVEIGKKMGVIC